MTPAEWEALWAPYDAATYAAVLALIDPQDAVLEIGAGDLRLSRQMAAQARQVYAIEIQADVFERGLQDGPLPPNLALLPGDARSIPYPPEITVGVLLMRHCTHFRLYAERLKAAGCQRMVTNARWRMGVESVSLQTPRPSWRKVTLGWYACWCGGVGFIPGPAELITSEVAAVVHEVGDCPDCAV